METQKTLITVIIIGTGSTPLYRNITPPEIDIPIIPYIDTPASIFTEPFIYKDIDYPLLDGYIYIPIKNVPPKEINFIHPIKPILKGYFSLDRIRRHPVGFI